MCSSTGENRIQEALNARGYEAGPAGGVMGPKTHSIVRTYRSDARIVAGQISPFPSTRQRCFQVFEQRQIFLVYACTHLFHFMLFEFP